MGRWNAAANSVCVIPRRPRNILTRDTRRIPAKPPRPSGRASGSDRAAAKISSSVMAFKCDQSVPPLRGAPPGFTVTRVVSVFFMTCGLPGRYDSTGILTALRNHDEQHVTLSQADYPPFRCTYAGYTLLPEVCPVARLQHRARKLRRPPRSPVCTAAQPTPAPRRRGYCAAANPTRSREMQVIELGGPNGRWKIRGAAIAIVVAAGLNVGSGAAALAADVAPPPRRCTRKRPWSLLITGPASTSAGQLVAYGIAKPHIGTRFRRLLTLARTLLCRT